VRYSLRGVIASGGFTSGHRVVIGDWSETPIGPMVDVMWCDPHGRRTLFAPDAGVARFIEAVYQFDDVVVAPFTATGNGWAVRIELADRMVELVAGPGWRIPVGRPAWFTRLVEAPLGHALLGVRTYGTSPSGVREWYRADASRPVQCGFGRLAGQSLGRLALEWEPALFGFSEPPSRASLVEVRPLLEDPSGRLDRALSAAVGERQACGRRLSCGPLCSHEPWPATAPSS